MKKLFILFAIALCFPVFAEPGESYEFLVIGDLHYDYRGGIKDGQYERRYTGYWATGNAQKLLRETLAPIEEGTDFAIQLGDLWNGLGRNQAGQEKGLRLAWETFRPLVKGPVYPIIGNHESYDYDSGTKYASAAYANVMEKYIAKELGWDPHDHSYAFMHGPDLFIFLDSNEDGIILKKVQKFLKQYPKSRYTFICSHHPVLPTTDWDIVYKKPFIHDPDFEFRREVMKRNPIFLTADLHRLSFADYVTGEGRLTQLIINSIYMPRHGQVQQDGDDDLSNIMSNGQKCSQIVPGLWEAANSVQQYPCLLRGNKQDPVSPGWIKKYYTPGITKFWFGLGSGVCKIRVSKDRVEADFYAYWNPGKPAKTFVVTAPGLHAASLRADLPAYFKPGVNPVKIHVPEELAKEKDLQYRFSLPEGWKTDGKISADGVVNITVPERTEAPWVNRSLQIRLIRPDGTIAANEFQPLHHKVLFSAEYAPDVKKFFEQPMPPLKEKRAMRLGWNKDYLLASVSIVDPKPVWQTEKTYHDWWFATRVQLFFDFENKRAYDRDFSEVSSCIGAPVAAGGVHTFTVDGAIHSDKTEFSQYSYDKKDQVFHIDFVIPWKWFTRGAKTFVPESGKVFGFDAACTNESLTGGEGTEFSTPAEWNHPSQWGFLRLE